MIQDITDFFQKGAGTQLRSPGGLSLDPEEVMAIETQGEPNGYLKIYLRGHVPITLTFHRNVDGGPAEIYEIGRRIEAAAKKAALLSDIPG